MSFLPMHNTPQVDVAPTTPSSEWAQMTTSALDEGGHGNPLIPHFATTTTNTTTQDNQTTTPGASGVQSSQEKENQAVADAMNAPVRPGLREEKTTIFNAHEKAILKAQDQEKEGVADPAEREKLVAAARGKQQEKDAEVLVGDASKMVAEAVGMAKELVGTGYEKLPTAEQVQATTQNLAQGAQQVLASATETAKAYVPENVANYLPATANLTKQSAEATTQNFAQGAQQAVASATETAKAYVPGSVANYLPATQTKHSVDAQSQPPTNSATSTHAPLPTNPTNPFTDAQTTSTTSTHAPLPTNSTNPFINAQPEHSTTTTNSTRDVPETSSAFAPVTQSTPAQVEHLRAQAHPETVPLPRTPAGV